MHRDFMQEDLPYPLYLGLADIRALLKILIGVLVIILTVGHND